MADKQVVVEIVYDTEEANKNMKEFTSEQNKRVSALTDEVYDLGEANKVLGKKIKDVTGVSKQDIEIKKKLNQELQNNKDKIKSANSERRNAIKSITGEKTAFDKLTASINKSNKSNQKTLDTMSQMPGPLGGAINGIRGMTKAALAFIATPIGAVIAAIGLALGALMRYFKGSEEGQNKLNKIMLVFKTIAGNIDDLIQKLGKNIMKAFDDPKETIKKLGDFIKTNLINRFKALGVMGKAIAKIFSKDWKEGLKDLGNGFIQLNTGITDFTGKVQKGFKKAKDAMAELNAEMRKEIGIAQNLADRQARLDKLQRGFLTQRAIMERSIAEFRLVAADKENVDAETRYKALKDAIALEEKILETEVKIANEKANIMAAQNALSNSTKEDLDAEAQLRAEAVNVETASLKSRKLLASELVSVERELAKEKTANIEADKELAEQSYQDAISMMNQIAAFKAEEKEKEKLLTEQALQDQFDGMQMILAATQAMADQRVTILGDAFSQIASINFAELKNSKDTFLAIGHAAKGLTNVIIAEHAKELSDLEASKQAQLGIHAGDAEKQAEIEKKFARKRAELDKKQFEDNKKKSILDGIIATSLAIVKGLASGLPVPGIAMAAIAGTLGAFQVASIARQRYTPTLAKGGVIGGDLHANGGTTFHGTDGSAFEAERGEALFVLNRNASAEIAALSQINESHGGRSLSAPGSSHLADGGEVSTNSIRNSVAEEIQRTPIFVKVGDIETGMTDTQQVKKAGVI